MMCFELYRLSITPYKVKALQCAMIMHGIITSVPFLLELLHNADARLKSLRADPRAPPIDVADEAANVLHLRTVVSQQAKALMPQTVFRTAFWRQLTDFSDSTDAAAVFAHIASVPLIRGEFFEAVVVACQMIQTVPRQRPMLVDLVFGWAMHQDQPFVVVAVRDVVVARILYRHSAGRILVTEIVVG